MKKWINVVIKTFVNDCSIGLALIVLGFIAGVCYINLFHFLQNIFMSIK